MYLLKKKKYTDAGVSKKTVRKNIDHAHLIKRKFVKFIEDGADDITREIQNGRFPVVDLLRRVYEGLDKLVVVDKEIFVDMHEGRLHTFLEMVFRAFGGLSF